MRYLGSQLSDGLLEGVCLDVLLVGDRLFLFGLQLQASGGQHFLLLLQRG